MAALLASLPRTSSWASITCHCRTMPFLEGNSVLIDTHVSDCFSYKTFSLRVLGGHCQIGLHARVRKVTPLYPSRPPVPRHGTDTPVCRARTLVSALQDRESAPAKGVAT